MSANVSSWDDYPYLFLPRPSGQLRSLPVAIRWEVTRRHPIYSSFWTSARDFYSQDSSHDGTPALLRDTAAELLAAIGISGEVPDPCLEFEDLGGSSVRSGWLSGAVSPVMLRGMLGLLIANLSSNVFIEITARLASAMDQQSSEFQRHQAAMLALQQLQIPELNQLIDEPIVAINPRFATRQVNKELKDLLRNWREERQISESRDRSDLYADYLRVWDLREGWSNGNYDNSEEMRLSDVARETGLELSAVNQRYRRAFELITGHPYSPPMWLRFMAIIKLSSQACDVIGNIARHRPLVSPTPRDVPDSVLRRREAGESVTQRATSREGSLSTGLADLILDIQSLLQLGKTDQQILQELELPSEASELIQTYRTHLEIPEGA